MIIGIVVHVRGCIDEFSLTGRLAIWMENGGRRIPFLFSSGNTFVLKSQSLGFLYLFTKR